MKKMQFVIAALLLAALMVSACQTASPPSGGGVLAPTKQGGESGSTNPTPTVASSQPTPTAESEQPSPGEGQPVELSDVSEGLGALDSYKAVFNLSFDGTDENGQPVQSSMSFEEEFQKNPPAKHFKITGLGADAASIGNIETIEVGGKTYTFFGDTCISADASEAPTASATLNPSDIIGSVRTAQLVGAENINGVPAKHYLVDVTGLEAFGYAQAEGEAWIADPGNFLVKYVFEATGTDTTLGFLGGAGAEGTIHWDYEVTDVNQPVDISAPENCGGAAEDIPLMPDAQDTASFGEMTTYSSASPLDDVVAFYRAEMPANGWTEDESAGGLSTDELAMLTYTKEGRTASITITFDSSSNTTSVLISVSGE